MPEVGEKKLVFGKIFTKNCMKMKQIGPRGRPSLAPLDPPMILSPSGDPSRLVRGFGGVPAAAQRDAKPRRHHIDVQLACRRHANHTVVKLIISEHRG